MAASDPIEIERERERNKNIEKPKTMGNNLSRGATHFFFPVRDILIVTKK